MKLVLPLVDKHATCLRMQQASYRERLAGRIGRCLSKSAGKPYLDKLTGVISNWAELAQVAQYYTDRQGGGWIFRGQSFPHSLRPKIGRPDARKDALTDEEVAYRARDEKWLLEQFMHRGRPYITFEPKTDLDWLAVGQHYGLATRMLDWTESFFVAVFFAIEKAGTGGSATIYAAPRPPRIRAKDRAFKLDRPRLYQAPDISPRITAQRGVFTAHPNPIEPYAPDGLEQWLFRKSCCYNIKKQLHLCGINRSVIYPDIAGLADYLNWRYKRPKSIPLE